jgi:signal transduction histidine kinase
MDKLEAENKKLKEMVEFKSDLISMMAHQLRTSLSASKWVLKMMLDGDLGPITDEQKTFLSKTYESNEKMIHFLSEMIDVSHQEDTDIIYTYEENDIVDIVDDVLTDFTGEAKQRKIAIHFKKLGTILIECNADKIKTALQVLIENALKYSKEGGDIFVNIDRGDHDITISVKDSGIGIGQEEKENIFNKFFRAKNAKKKENVGSGLGLYAAKRIVEKHKGKIWFESEEDKGSTFFISLPIQSS